MITVTCHHCSAKIEVDTATRVALKKSLQFQCPGCSGFLPTNLLNTENSSDTSSSINRNLLILGMAVLIVLGGLSFILASKKSGDTNTTVQNIRNEVINNSYFQTLIATGATTQQELEAIEDIRPYQDGFIGISAAKLDWKEANAMALRTGATVLEADSDTGWIAWLTKTFALSSTSSAWVLSEGDAGLLTSEGAFALKDADGVRKVLLHWIPSKAAVDPSGLSTDGLVAYYPFNGNAEDASGNDFHAVIHGAELTKDKAGNSDSAYLFNGSSSFIVAPVNISPDVMPNMTMIAWARADTDQPVQQLMSQDLPGYCRSIGIDMRGGGIGWSAFCGTAGVLGYEPVKLKKWNFAAVVYEDDREMVTLYVNGRKMMKQGAPPKGMKNLTIGASPVHPEFFHGVIDEVRIYNRALNDSEIQELYQTFNEQIDPESDKQTEAYAGRKLSEVADLGTSAVLVNDEFNDPNKSGFVWAVKDQFKDGRITLDGMGKPCWGTSADQFNNFTCEVVARTTRDKHFGWGLCVYKDPGGGAAQGVEVLLDSEGQLSVVPCRWVSKGQKDIDPIGPVPVASFKKGEFNSLVVAFSEGRKLAVFVNGSEACAPIVLPYILVPAGLQLASAGGASMQSRLEFESYKVFSSLIGAKFKKQMWGVTGEQGLIDLSATKTEVGFWQLLAGEHPEKRLVVIKDQPRTDYLLAHAPSRVEYDIPAGAATFKALGLSTSNQNCTFSVAIDGKVVFSSKTLDIYKHGVVNIDVMLPKNAKKLTIMTTNIGSFQGCQTCWVEPRFVKDQQKPNSGESIPDVATPAPLKPEQSATDDVWIDNQGRIIHAIFLRIEGETLVIDFKNKETRIPLSRLSTESRALALKRQAESNP